LQTRPGDLDVSVLVETTELDHCVSFIKKRETNYEKVDDRQRHSKFVEDFDDIDEIQSEPPYSPEVGKIPVGVRFSETVDEYSSENDAETLERIDTVMKALSPVKSKPTIRTNEVKKQPRVKVKRITSPASPQTSVPTITTDYDELISQSPRSPSRPPSPKHTHRHSPYSPKKSSTKRLSTLDFFKQRNQSASPSPASSPELIKSPSKTVYQTPMIPAGGVGNTLIDDGLYAKFKEEVVAEQERDTDPRIRACSPTWHISQKISSAFHAPPLRSDSIESLAGNAYHYEPTIKGIYTENPSLASSFSVGLSSRASSYSAGFTPKNHSFSEIDGQSGLLKLDGMRTEINALSTGIKEISRGFQSRS
jgi:hypothetical protein